MSISLDICFDHGPVPYPVLERLEPNILLCMREQAGGK